VWPSQPTALATSETIHELLDSLPRNINMDMKTEKEQRNSADVRDNTTFTTTSMNLRLDTLTEEQWDDEEEEEQNDDEDLVVAWQYRKDIQQERLGISASSTSEISNVVQRRYVGNDRHATVYCHSYNLQGRLSDQMDIYSLVSMIPICAEWTESSRVRGVALYRQLVSAAVSATQPSNHRNSSRSTVARILLYHPDMIMCAFALPLFLHYIRQHRLPVVVLVIPPSKSSNAASVQAALTNVRRCSDVVMSTESFTMRSQYPPPLEFRHLQGLLHVSRLSTMTQSTISGHFADRTIQRSPTAIRYGLHRDRRKLNISLLHIPPEDYAAEGGSVSSGAVRSGAGRPNSTSSLTTGNSCGGGDGKSPLDF
jgi:PAXNEB protein